MKDKENLEIENDLNRKLLILKKTLRNIEEIFILFKPLFEKIINLKESDEFVKDGSFHRAASLFREISKDFIDIGGFTNISEEFLKNLMN